jgi:hypothetical protein
MKKIFLCIFFIIAITKTNAESLFDFSWNLGTLGWGLNYSSNDDDNFELNGTLFNFILEQKEINIDFEFSPLKYWYLFKFQNEPETKYNGERLSFINANMYWYLIGNKSVLLGPFVSINYLFVNALNGINMNEYIFGTGLRFSWRPGSIVKTNNYNDQLLSTEIGYRNTNGNNKFYFSINIDLIAGLMVIGEAARVQSSQPFQKNLTQRRVVPLVRGWRVVT